MNPQGIWPFCELYSFIGNVVTSIMFFLFSKDFLSLCLRIHVLYSAYLIPKQTPFMFGKNLLSIVLRALDHPLSW